MMITWIVECTTPMASQIPCAEARAFSGSVALMWADTTVLPRVSDHTCRQWRSVTPVVNKHRSSREGATHERRRLTIGKREIRGREYAMKHQR